MEKKIKFLFLIIIIIFLYSSLFFSCLFGDVAIINILSPSYDGNIIGPNLAVSGTIKVANKKFTNIKAYIKENNSIYQIDEIIFENNIVSDSEIDTGTFNITLDISSLQIGKKYTIVVFAYNESEEKSNQVFTKFNLTDLDPEVYVLGQYYKYVDYRDIEIPCYWENGNRVDLNVESYETTAESIFLAGYDVYVCGYYYNGSKYIACYWKNGIRYDIQNGTFNTYAKSIFLSGEDLYIAGYYFNGSQYVACYWKNGTKIDLTDGKFSSKAYSILVYGEEIYVCGNYHNNTELACYWKNGVIVDLTNGTKYSQAFSIFFSGNDLYIFGDYDFWPCYWKNGSKIELTYEAYGLYAESIFVSGVDLYIAGYYFIDARLSAACYWKNGTKIDLKDETYRSYANSIFVSGDDIYIAGDLENYDENIACYWKNGVRVNLHYNGRAFLILKKE